MLSMTLLVMLLVVVIGVGLVLKSMPILSTHSLGELIGSSQWHPSKEEFGFLPFILGTLYVTGMAILWTLPLSLLTAILLTENSAPWVRKVVYPVLDILAGIPSVVYGVWGIVVVVPWVADGLAPHFQDFSTGYTMLTASVVLGVMVLPLMISLFVEIFDSTPDYTKEASTSLGATRWQTVKHVVLKKNFGAIFAVIMLSISRAMGETIAVLMVCGNVVQVPASPLDAAYTIPSLIANNYGEMLSVPLYDSALMFAALLLLVIVIVFNIVSRLILRKIEKKYC